MRIPSQLVGVLTVGCALGLSPLHSGAAPTDEDFNALKDLVTKQGQRLDQLEKVHDQDQKTIQQDQQQHQQDQQEIQRLKQQLQETQATATNAQQKAEAAMQALPPPPGPLATHNFTMVGDAEVQFGKIDGQHSGFALADFAPIFLFRGGDKILFEAGFDATVQNGASTLANGQPGNGGSASTSFSLSFATLDYAFSDYATFVGGYMILPLGTYPERSAGWLNLVPTDPLPRSIGLVPDTGAGVQLRGGVPIGTSGQALTYAAYVVNGPNSADGSGTAANLVLDGNVGLNSNGDFMGNLHGTPSGGGRIGWFIPWKNQYSLELGASAISGPWDNADQEQYTAGVIDASLHLGPSIWIEGEYLYSWAQTTDSGTLHPHGWWIQASYALSGLNLDLPVINNLQLVGRYGKANSFLDGGTVFGKADRYTIGYVYYFSNTLLFEGDYEFASSDDDNLNHNRLIFQVSYGF